MPTKIELIANPDDTDAYDAALPDLLEKAKAMPGITRLVSGTVWPKVDGSPRPAHASLILWFEDYDAASAAAASEASAAFFPAFIGASGQQVTGLFTDVHEVWEA